MTINAAWHKRHVLARNATVERRVAWHLAHQKHCACRPVPAKLVEQMARSPARSPGNRGGRSSLRALLAGGDRRSVAQSGRAHAIIQRAPARVSELAALAGDNDWLVSMRTMDLLEKLAHEHPEWVQPHNRLFIGPLADSEQWEIRLQVVRALPLLAWTARQHKRVVEILRRDIEHPEMFVRAWALDSLATFATSDDDLMPIVSRAIGEFERSGSKALATRARHIRQRLGDRPA